MIADLYRPGRTALHRLPAGAKLGATAMVGTLLFLLPLPGLALGALAATLAGCIATLGVRFALRALRTSLPVVVLVSGFQLWFDGTGTAMLFGARLAALLLLGAMLVATTRPSEIAAAVERAASPILRPIGVDPARVGLAIGLTIRFVPVLAAVAAEIREAQAARGLDRSLFALGVPLVVRTLKMADEIAEAIDARS